IRGDPGCGRNDLLVRDAIHVVLDRGVNVIEGLDSAGVSRAGRSANGERGFGRTSPGPFQIVNRGIILAPLSSHEHTPLERVLEDIVGLALPAPAKLGAGSLDVDSL